MENCPPTVCTTAGPGSLPRADFPGLPRGGFYWVGDMSLRSGVSSYWELLQQRAKPGPPGPRRPKSVPLASFGGPALPVLGGEVQTLLRAQELVVTQPQVLQAWRRAGTQTLHAADGVVVELQHLGGGEGAWCHGQEQ